LFSVVRDLMRLSRASPPWAPKAPQCVNWLTDTSCEKPIQFETPLLSYIPLAYGPKAGCAK
jgi:hypothetical protein